MRLQALETFSESKKNKLLALTAKLAKKKCKKSRSSGTDTLNYFRENGEREQNFKMS